MSVSSTASGQVTRTLSSNVGQMYSHLFDLVQCLLSVFKHLNSMVWFAVESTERLFGEDFL